MSIYVNKQITTSNGAMVGHHKIVSAILSNSLLTIDVDMESWYTEQSRIAGQPSVARSMYRLPIASMGSSASFVADMRIALTGTDGLSGGVIVPDAIETLEGRKYLKRAEIKAQRNAHILAAGATPVGVFDTTPESMANITSVVVMLLAAPMLASINFTLANNSRPSIARADFLTAAQTVAAQVQGVYDHGAALRAQIDAATTIAGVEAIVW